MIRYHLLLAVVFGLFSYVASGDDFPKIYNSEADQAAMPMPAADAAAAMQLPDGFHVDVFASEPDVQNPIAICWDQKNRLWVAENYTYAERTQRFDLSLRDRVVILADTDNDGRADSRKVFADNAQMLTSVEVGRGGVWLMCPPQLLFIPDANEDDVPDGPAEVVLDGFTVAQENYHNFANGLRWGPDGWLYGRCGHSCPGRIGPPGTSEESRIPLDGGIWRFSPDKKVVEVLCHGTTNPWGHDWDQHGELFFINTVIGHLWHMMPGAHMKESFGESMNPLVYERLDMVADHYHFDSSANWTDSRGGKANDFGGGHAHIGMMIYQSSNWPEQYHNKLFTLNMHGYRANVERLERRGAGYVGKHEPDFLIAKDPFFRGVEINVGPDGNVYVVDWSDTGECHEHNGVHRSSGRIFKVSYGKSISAPSLVKPSCVAGDGKLPKLWRDYQSGKTTPESLRLLLTDSDEHVRVWAIRLLTDYWPLDTLVGPLPNAEYRNDQESYAAFVSMADDDPSGLVLSTLASTLQRLPVDKRPELAKRILSRPEFADDRDLPLLVWFGLMPVAVDDPMALASVAESCQYPSTLRYIARNLMSQIEQHPQAIGKLLSCAATASDSLQVEIIDGMLQATSGWRVSPEPVNWKLVSDLVGVRSPEKIRSLAGLFGDGRALDELRQIAQNDKIDFPTRQSALTTVIEARPADLRKICESLLGVRSLNLTAAKGLALFDDPAVAAKLVASYRRFHPTDRPALVELLLSRPSFVKVLLDHVGDANGRIPSDAITPFHARQIQSLGQESLNRKLSEVWGELRDSSTERRQTIADLGQQLTPAVLKSANLAAGRALFNKTCATCHVLFGEGTKIGPDLTGAQRSSLDYLLENIVDPSAVVGKDYRMTQVITNDGRVFGGLIVSQDDKTLVIQTQTDRQTILKSEIEEIRDTTLSPMPDGMLDTFSSDQRRDLIGYLMHPIQVSL